MDYELTYANTSTRIGCCDAALNNLLMEYSTIRSVELLECTSGNSKKQVSTISSDPFYISTQEIVVTITNTAQHKNHFWESALKSTGSLCHFTESVIFQAFLDPTSSVSFGYDVRKDEFDRCDLH